MSAYDMEIHREQKGSIGGLEYRKILRTSGLTLSNPEIGYLRQTCGDGSGQVCIFRGGVGGRGQRPNFHTTFARGKRFLTFILGNDYHPPKIARYVYQVRV